MEGKSNPEMLGKPLLLDDGNVDAAVGHVGPQNDDIEARLSQRDGNEILLGSSSGVVDSEVSLNDSLHSMPRSRKASTDTVLWHSAYSLKKRFAEATGAAGATLQVASRRSKYYIPILHWGPNYIRNWATNFPSDVLAGITIGVMMVPQGLAYAELVGVPSMQGLYTCVFPGVFYFALATSRQNSIGAEALVALLVGSTVSSMGITDPAERASAASFISLMMGFILLGLGLLRLGFLDAVFSLALLRGFILAVAVVIMCEQLDPLLGIPKDPGAEAHTAREIVVHVFEKLDQVHWQVLIVSVASVAFLGGVGVAKSKFRHVRWLQLLPQILVLVVASTTLSYLCDLQNNGVPTLGKIEGGLATPAIPRVKSDQVQGALSGAVLVAVIGFIEHMASTKMWANKHHYGVSSNRELVALGMANSVDSLFGSFGAFASLPRSHINDSVGAKSAVSVLVGSIVVLIAAACLVPLFECLPKAVMASIVFMAALSLIEVEEVIFLYQIAAWIDLALLSLVFIITITAGIQLGIVVAVSLSLLLLVQRTAAPRIAILGRVGSAGPFKDMDEFPQASSLQGVLCIKVQEPLHFANTAQMKDVLRRIELYGSLCVHPSEDACANHGTIRAVVFDIGEMPNIDASATHSLLGAFQHYKASGVRVCLVHLRDKNKTLFFNSGIIDVVGAGNVFADIESAVNHVTDPNGIHPNFSSYADVDIIERSSGGGGVLQ